MQAHGDVHADAPRDRPEPAGEHELNEEDGEGDQRHARRDLVEERPAGHAGQPGEHQPRNQDSEVKRDSMEPVSRAELLARSRAGLVTVLDVRPRDEFAMGHLPGAINVPLEELEARLAGLDPDQEVVAYCRGAYCVLSFEAVARLRARGF